MILTIASRIISASADGLCSIKVGTINRLLIGFAWILLPTLGFYLNISSLLPAFDGRYYIALSSSHQGIDWPWFLDTIDFWHGIGDQLFPFRPEIIPFFRILSALNYTDMARVASFCCLFIELAASIIFLARNLGLKLSDGLMVAATACVALLPLWNQGAIYSFIFIAPTFSSMVAAAVGITGLYLRLGRGRLRTDLACLVGILSLLVWLLLASPMAFMLPAPLLGITTMVGLISATGRHERIVKATALVLVAILLLSGPGWYVLAQVKSSAAYEFNVELQNYMATWSYASIFFHAQDVGLMGPILVVSALIGAAMHWRSPNKVLRFLGYGIISYLVTRLSFAWLVITFDFYRGPAPIYFELCVVPLYCVFAWLFWKKTTIWLFQRLTGSDILSDGMVAVLSVVVLGIAVAPTNARVFSDPYTYPPARTPITDYLSEHAALQNGKPFQGRVATMTGQNVGGTASWFDMIGQVDAKILHALGNDHRLSGLRHFRIPVLLEYSPLTPGPFHVIVTRLLGNPEDIQARNIQVARHVDPRIMALLGARFLVIDAPVSLPGVELRASVPVEGSQTLFLYEVPNPNLGQYSPIQITVQENAAATLAEMASPRFDPTMRVLLDSDTVPGPLVPVTGGQFIFEGPRLHVTAHSNGQSLLLLPLEYSHCLAAEALSGAAPRLLRADLALTGVLFQGDVDVRIGLDTSPFRHPLCRFADNADDRRMQVGQVPRFLPNAR